MDLSDPVVSRRAIMLIIGVAVLKKRREATGWITTHETKRLGVELNSLRDKLDYHVEERRQDQSMPGGQNGLR
jgi:hypothetical protein